jgi:regulator of sigma E protease
VDILGLTPQFGGFLYTVVSFVIALSIIVAVHEFGHYIIGRWSGIQAEVFSLGFGPRVISRTDKRGTRWQISVIPLGGYVRFLGDSNAASGKDGAAMEALTPSELRRSMHGAPLWARSATVAAGPVFNFILSIVVFAGLYLAMGVPSNTPEVGSLVPLPGQAQTLKVGDKILAVNGTATPDSKTFGAVVNGLPEAATTKYTVERAGQTLTFDGPFPFPALVGQVQPQSAAAAAGIQVGDVIESVDGTAIGTFNQLRVAVGKSDGKPMALSVWRDGKTLSLTLTPKRMDVPAAGGSFETRWLIGIVGNLAFEPVMRTPGPFEAVRMAVSQIGFIIQTNVSGLYHMLTGAISSCNLKGPVGIAEASGAVASQGAVEFIGFIAMLSTAVGLLNLFPVPVLDGGHLVFFAWEALTGRPPSEGALKLLMGGGILLILTLVVFSLSNDVFCP